MVVVLRRFLVFSNNKLISEACNFIKKETLAQVLSCEFCEISKNTFFDRTPLVAASHIPFLAPLSTDYSIKYNYAVSFIFLIEII